MLNAATPTSFYDTSLNLKHKSKDFTMNSSLITGVQHHWESTEAEFSI